MGWGILQIVVFVVLLGLIAKPLGLYMAHVFRGERTFLHPVVRPRRESDLSPMRRRRDARDGRRRLRGLAARVQLRGAPLHLRRPAAAGSPAAEPGARSGHEPDGRLQHRRQLRHQHQLAGLRPRDSGQLSLADARPGARELRLGGSRHRGRRGVHPRAHPALQPRAGQLLGRPHALHPLRASAPLDRRHARAGLAGRGAEPERPDTGGDGRGGHADHRAGTVRLTGDHQGAGHQRRRLLQRQLVAPVREPHAAQQPHRGPGASSPSRSRSPTPSGGSRATSDRGGRCSRPPWSSCS